MSWVVDTCVLIDVARGDRDFASASATALDLKREEGLSISPLTYVELSPSFNGDAEQQDEFLLELGVDCEFSGNRASVLKAHRAWNEHILRKRAGESVKRPIADVMIGAYALARGGLITRNESDYKTLYPTLRVFNPVTDGCSTPYQN